MFFEVIPDLFLSACLANTITDVLMGWCVTTPRSPPLSHGNVV